MLIIALVLAAQIHSVQDGAWSDPATWGGATPSVIDLVAVDHNVVVDGIVSTSGIVVTGSLSFGGPTHISSSGNVIVDGGVLSMVSLDPSVEKRLTFVGISEAAFVGGGNTPLATDVGLWVVNGGILDAHGASKTAWTHLVSGAQGSSTIVVDDGSGWQVGDELVAAPMEPPTVSGFASHFDRRRIVAVDDGMFTLDAPLAFPHPVVDSHRAEVLNLTRNVVIEGTATGRSHIAIVDSYQQVDLGYVEVRHMGPRQAVPGSAATSKVLGRYALHVHHGGDDLMGSLLEGVSVHDTGSHAYVAHAANGVTIRDCLSYNTREDAYWFDPGVENGSDFLLYDHNVAALVIGGSSSTDRRLTAFRLGSGEGNEVRNSVAVGVQGRGDASGFQWSDGSSSVWQFSGNLTHNNVADGVFVWQNGHGSLHVVGDLAIFYVGDAGIEHGAYFNAYQWQSVDIYGAGVAGVALDATSGKDTQLTFADIHIDGAGITPTGWSFRGHNATRVNGILVAHRGLIQGGFVKNLKPGGRAFACMFAAPPAQNWYDLWTVKDVDLSGVPESQRFDVFLCKPESSFVLINGKSTRILHTTASVPKWNGYISDLTPTFGVAP